MGQSYSIKQIAPKYDRYSFGRMIKETRERRGMSLDDIVVKLNWERNMLTFVEEGRIPMSMDEFSTFLTAFVGCSDRITKGEIGDMKNALMAFHESVWKDQPSKGVKVDGQKAFVASVSTNADPVELSMALKNSAISMEVARGTLELALHALNKSEGHESEKERIDSASYMLSGVISHANAVLSSSSFTAGSAPDDDGFFVEGGVYELRSGENGSLLEMMWIIGRIDTQGHGSTLLAETLSGSLKPISDVEGDTIGWTRVNLSDWYDAWLMANQEDKVLRALRDAARNAEASIGGR